eukprot:GHVS01031915.1.p1 GENE.GHVS01031915.1~~GHVS01031915.1.p1  ORF type:complete len:383 (-),score=49.81 GHVS01031915.1:549-1697(-)
MACESFYEAAQLLEKLLVREDGNRDITGGVKSLYSSDCSGQLYDCAGAIFDSKCECVVLLVGSTSNMIMWPPTDTDGPGGCFAITHTLLHLGKKVIIVCDTVNDGQVKPAFEKSDAWRYNDRKLLDKVRYEVFQEYRNWKDGEEEKRLEEIFKEANHIINVGRPGPAEDGHYYSHDKRQMTHYQPDFVKLFKMSEESRGSEHHVQTTCIGELGNELGIGQLKSRVEENVPNGGTIACNVKADNVIVATTVNWGSYGLCAMLGIVAVVDHKGDKPILLDDLYPNRQEQSAVLNCLVEEAARCGVTGTRDMQIDKYPSTKIWEVMENIRNEAREISIKMSGDTGNKVMSPSSKNRATGDDMQKVLKGMDEKEQKNTNIPVNGVA